MMTECVVGVRHEEQIVALQRRAEELHQVDEKQWDAINALQHRLPAWATVTMSVGGTIAGLLIGVLSTLLAV